MFKGEGYNTQSQTRGMYALKSTTVTCDGNWVQAEPTGCATKCGVAEGASGTPGAVTCSTSSCDADAKPAAKQCPKTVDCGAFDRGMVIVNGDFCHSCLSLFLLAPH